ncbi:MAG TPA: 16S rRNA (uracil(1498)-N(3))-methyltransferase [Jiangellaceae bacterium]
MSLPVFWMDAQRLRAGDRLQLDGDEGHHAAVVRRIRAGELIELTDGAGHVARCVVVDVGRRGLTCEVRSRSDVPPHAPRVTVVQALPKGDRGELAVELMTEVGVDVIVPWAAGRCITQWKGERGAKALRKWRSTAREAAKQSRRAWFPDVTELATTAVVVNRVAAATPALVMHEGADRGLGDLTVPLDGDVVLVVGPEGGITDDELELLTAAGGLAVRLGPTVLRTSTAGAVGAGILLSRTARWS